MKLSRPGAAAPAETGHQQTQAQSETNAPAARKGWGASAANSAPANDSASGAVEGQRERIAATLTGGQLAGGQQEGDSRQETARSAFSGGVAKLRESIQQEHGDGANDAKYSNGVRTDAEPPADTAKPRTRRTAAPAVDMAAMTGVPVIHNNVDAKHSVNVADNFAGDVVRARAAIMAAIVPNAETPEDALAMANMLWDWVVSGTADQPFDADKLRAPF